MYTRHHSCRYMGAEQVEVSTWVWATTGEIKGAGGCKYMGSSGGRKGGGVSVELLQTTVHWGQKCFTY